MYVYINPGGEQRISHSGHRTLGFFAQDQSRDQAAKVLPAFLPLPPELVNRRPNYILN